MLCTLMIDLYATEYRKLSQLQYDNTWTSWIASIVVEKRRDATRRTENQVLHLKRTLHSDQTQAVNRTVTHNTPSTRRSVERNS